MNARPQFVHEIPEVETSMGAPGEWWIKIEGKPVGWKPLRRAQAEAIAEWLTDNWKAMMDVALRGAS